MDFIGTARTNYFTPTNKTALEDALAPFGLALHNSRGGDQFCIIPDEGIWPSMGYDAVAQKEVDFSFEDTVMPFVKEGDVVVAMEAGAEGARYIAGTAMAYIRKGDTVQDCYIDLDGIYKLAANTFNIPVSDIPEAKY